LLCVCDLFVCIWSICCWKLACPFLYSSLYHFLCYYCQFSWFLFPFISSPILPLEYYNVHSHCCGCFVFACCSCTD
jgi:hypothetical protein